MTAPVDAGQAARAASTDTATSAELLGAGERGRLAGVEAFRSGRRQRCPFPLGSLTAHTWLRWYVYARLQAAGLE